MAVRPDSVIELWVNALNPTFYTALTNQEEFFYDSAETLDPLALPFAIDLIQLLMDTLNAWKAESAPSRSASSLNAIPNFIYTYNMYRERFGMEEVDADLLDAKNVYDMGGFPAVVISRAVGYYDDIIEDPLNPGEYISDKVDADIATMDAGVWLPMEQENLAAVESIAVGNVRAMNGKSLFDGLPSPPEPPIVPMTKQELAEWIYLTLNWKWVKDTFPAASGMDIPLIITDPPGP